MRYVLLSLIVLLTIACQREHSTTKNKLGNYTVDGVAIMSEEIETEPPRTAHPPNGNTIEKPSPGSMMIKTGNISFSVNDVQKAKDAVDSIVNQMGGYYENESYSSQSQYLRYSLQIRVPNTAFDSLIYLLELGAGALQHKSLSSKDVSEEYVDLGIRLENKLAVLAQYRQLLTKANEIKDILDVQEKIRRLEEEIESKKGRMRYLESKVQFASLHVDLQQLLKGTKKQTDGFLSRLARAFKDGSTLFQNFILAMVHLWPFLLIVILLFVGRKKIATLCKRSKDQVYKK